MLATISRVTQAKLVMWKQRSKVKAAVEGDENTRYFHACANQRHRRNKIQIIEHDGSEVHNHDQKAAILHSFYLNLLGSPSTTTWNFDLNHLYPEGALVLDHMDAPFDKDEIHLAFRSMQSNGSPGPDGFGPLFFKALWATVSPDLSSLFNAFHSHEADIKRLNRSYLVLLPKKDSARKPQDFRPIALQNGTIKGISKVLTTRLQPLIPSLIGTDQSGFVMGRCIADSFAYAAELLHCCHQRRAPTIVLKLDFHKAFDCVAWDSLDCILRCRGFTDKWCTWISNLLSTGKTTVLLNGVPGRWINCRKGASQGDPLSPYMFIIVADVLRRLLQHHPLAISVRHPLSPDEACPIIQYADDTLIFIRCSFDAINATKKILQLFEQATGLSINYHKTIFAPPMKPCSPTLLDLTYLCSVSSRVGLICA